MVYLVLTAVAVGSIVAAVTTMLVHRGRGRAVAGPEAQLIEAAATRGAGAARARARAQLRFVRRF
jgi:hypothetical protein